MPVCLNFEINFCFHKIAILSKPKTCITLSACSDTQFQFRVLLFSPPTLINLEIEMAVLKFNCVLYSHFHKVEIGATISCPSLLKLLIFKEFFNSQRTESRRFSSRTG